MLSRFAAPEAFRVAEELGPAVTADLAQRIHTSRLLGADPALVLHGGGNTSVKSTGREHSGESVDVLWVKGSGGDLATIGPAGFACCRLVPLRALCRLDALDDATMVAALRSQMLDPGAPTPSVEALLHALLPGKFVDHTHADAALTLLDQPRAEQIAAEVWGSAFVYVPYVMPGFALARTVAALGVDRAGLTGLALGQHGIVTWGATAEESYERMIAAVTAAEEWRDRKKRHRPASLAAAGLPAADRAARRVALTPVVRGALTRAAGGASFLLEWRDDPAVLAFLAREDAPHLCARGTVTPDHVIRTRPRPMWIGAEGGRQTADGGGMRDAVEHALKNYRGWYDEYFAQGDARHGGALQRLDSLPRLVLVPGVGALTIGRTLADARIAGDIFARAIEVMQDAESIGRYEPVNEAHLFDIEYWSLEQAKLGRRGDAGPLAGRIALVTGAAAGIGLATAERLLVEGAHVMLSDRDRARLDEAVSTLRPRFGTRVACTPCDVTSLDSITTAVSRTVLAFGGVDLLISNAGTAPSGLLHTAAGEAALERSLDINLMSHQRMARSVVDVFLAQGTGGCLLFNASKSAVNPGREFGPYAIAKAGVLALMRQYAVDLGTEGIRANAINADRIRTDLFAGGVLEARAKARGVDPESYFRENLLGRETTASDVAAAFAWLARAQATTGCVISVDGGNAAAFLR